MKKRNIVLFLALFLLANGLQLYAQNAGANGENHDLLLKKARLFTSVLLNQHQLTYEEAVTLWGETGEVSMAFGILGSGIGHLDLLAFESVLEKKNFCPKYSLTGWLIQETLSRELISPDASFAVFYAIADHQSRDMRQKESIFPQGLMTITISKYHENIRTIYIITLPFEKNEFILTTATFGNRFIEEAMGVSCDTYGRPIFSPIIGALLEKMEKNQPIDLSSFRKAAKNNPRKKW